MVIYRFINDKGNGLYEDYFYTKSGLEMGYGDLPVYQPPMYEDIRGLKQKDFDLYKCAFTDMDQIASWFRHSEPLNIFLHDGKLLEITIDIKYIRSGNYQCVYLKDAPHTTREVTLDEFIELYHEFEERYRRRAA